MKTKAVVEVCITSPDGVCWNLKITNRGAVIVEKETPDGKDTASRDYANYQAILEKAWSKGIELRAFELLNPPTQTELDAAKIEFENYVDTHVTEIIKYKLGKQPVLIAIWDDANDNPFSTNIRTTISTILNEDPNA